jgi:hypothetical protein
MNQSFLTIGEIKQKLVSEYATYGDYIDKVLNILRIQGKRDMVDDIQKGKYILETAIMTDVYYITLLDLWVLAIAYKLPIIIFHQDKLRGLFNSVNWLILSEGTKYFFIRVPTGKDSPSNYLPKYNIVKPTIDATAPKMVELIKNAEIDSTKSLLEYLE